jgi:hypothetical protein
MKHGIHEDAKAVWYITRCAQQDRNLSQLMSSLGQMLSLSDSDLAMKELMM